MILATIFTLLLWYDPQPGSDTGIGVGSYGGTSLEECHRFAANYVLEAAANYRVLETDADGQLHEIVGEQLEQRRQQFIEGWRATCTPP